LPVPVVGRNTLASQKPSNRGPSGAWRSRCIALAQAEASMVKTFAGETAAIELTHRTATPVESMRDRSPDALADLFAPDIVLPEQFFEGARRDSYISGEKALMLAVLEDGIRCFQEHLRNPRSNPRLLSQQAEDWIRAVDYEWPFSFNNVCETLGVDPSALRTALLAWKAKRLAEGDENGGPTPTAKKVYRLHLRTKRTSGVR
jgi:hypothetical protein